ncbi:hypothetical protein C1645_790927 [Glomus cerebriforme]|uniref:Uncharacterized protein n=1 Tax=Glomus cerebriforme TaxID=658196 RepID=A0A397SB26_9GLOM|nr:hypothetical protein C1645_790927 [Glomus cerebriforme]
MLPQACEFGGLTLLHKIYLLCLQLNILHFYLFYYFRQPLSLERLLGLFCSLV